MNTKYKISLLLALGVVAGNSVSGKMNIEYSPMKDLPNRKPLVINEYSALNKGLKNVDDVAGLSEQINVLKKDIISKNGNALRVETWLDVSTGVLNNTTDSFGNLLLGVKDNSTTDALKKVFASEAAVDKASAELGSFVKTFEKACEQIKKGTLTQDITDVFIGMPTSTATGAKEAVNKWIGKTNSESRLTDVVNGLSDVTTAVSAINVRTNKADKYVKSVVKALDHLKSKVEELNQAEVTVENNEKISLKGALDNIVMGLTDVVGSFSKNYINIGTPNVGEINALKKAAERKLAVQTFANSINTNGVVGLGKILSKVVADDFLTKEADARVTYIGILDDTSSTDTAKKVAGNTYLAAFGEKSGSLTTVDDGLLFSYHTPDPKASHATDLPLAELEHALGGDPSSVSLTANTAANFDGTMKGKSLKTVDALRAALGAQTPGYTSTNSYELIKARRKSDSTTKLPDVTFNLDSNNALSEVKARPENAKKIIAAWTAETRASSAAATKQTLESEFQAIDKYLFNKSEPLFGKAPCEHPGIAKDFNRSQIDDLRQQIKAAYDAAIAACDTASGGATTPAQSTPVVPTTVDPALSGKTPAGQPPEVQKTEGQPPAGQDVTKPDNEAEEAESKFAAIESLFEDGKLKTKLDSDELAAKKTTLENIKEMFKGKKGQQLAAAKKQVTEEMLTNLGDPEDEEKASVMAGINQLIADATGAKPASAKPRAQRARGRKPAKKTKGIKKANKKNVKANKKNVKGNQKNVKGKVKPKKALVVKKNAKQDDSDE